MDSKLIEARIAARALAKQVADIATAEAPEDDASCEAYWLVLRQVCDEHLPRPEQTSSESPAMTDEQAREFGRCTQMPFGKHVGTYIDEVPLQYLEWYADLSFQPQLRKYLRSPRIKSELEAS